MFRRFLHDRLVILASVTLALIAALGGAMLTTAHSQSQASDLSFTVQAAPPWMIDEATSSDMSYVVKVDSEYANVLIGRFPANTTTEAADAAMLGTYAGHFDDVAVVESGTSGGMLYTLNLITIDGNVYGSFSLYTPQGASGNAQGYAILAPVSRFADAVTSAKASITVNDMPIFGGVAGDGLQSRLEQAAGTTAGAGADTAPLGAAPGATPAASPEATPAP
ncbi:MAG TPA: hypothetical protein VM450_04865 [Thermomicrobiales bacterium]|nr:hypothetical protein [Thermomicrobiales bacterium]